MSPFDRDQAKVFLEQPFCSRWRPLEHVDVDVLSYTYRVVSSEGHGVALLYVLRPELRAISGLSAGYIRAARIANTIHHPGVVKVEDAGISNDGLPYVVTLDVAGESLRDMLARRRGRVPPVEALRVTIEILDALSAAHDRAVFHGELQPRAVRIDETGEVRVHGFGWAKLYEKAATHWALLCAPGAAGYFSPEQARHKGASEVGDLWSAAAIAFELLSGRPLRKARKDEELLAEAALRPPPRFKQACAGAPSQLTQLLDTALAWNPAERFQSAEPFIAACRMAAAAPELAHVSSLDDERVVATEPALPRATPRPEPLTTLAPPPPHESLVTPGAMAAGARESRLRELGGRSRAGYFTPELNRALAAPQVPRRGKL